MFSEAKKNKPIFMSTGMASIEEIHDAISAIQDQGNEEIVIMHCITSYPTKSEDANLEMITSLNQEFPDYVVGYSDHTLGIDIAIFSTFYGSKCIEKHFTYDKNLSISRDHRLSLDSNDFKELIEIAGLDVNLVENIPNIKNWPFSPRASSKYLYEILGIKDYKSIDIGGKHGAIVHDLNKPFNDTSMFNKFDIATDFGSCEHVFNVSECYKTLHKLLKPGGYLIIDQAILKGNGYFKFDEVFFEGIAAANNYKIIFSSYVITTGEKTKNGSYYQFHIPRNHKLLDVLDYSKLARLDKYGELGIFAVMQKITDEEFKTPYQGTIYNDIHNISHFLSIKSKIQKGIFKIGR